jgi:hypothetical protein
VCEERLSFEGFHNTGHTVVSTHPEVVTLGNIVGKDHPGVLANPRQHGQQHIALQRLSLIHDDERIVE